MIHFITPFVAKDSIDNWDLAALLLRQTLDSPANQSDPEFNSVICCHDIPDFAKDYDERFKFVEHPSPPQSAKTVTGEFSGICDADWKRDVSLFHCDPEDQDFVMPIDADDLIHRDVVSELKNADGFEAVFINNGYEFCFKSRRLLERNNMVKRTSTSFALRAHLLNKPSSLDKSSLSKTLYHTVYHSNVIEFIEENSLPHKYLTTPSSVYRTNTSTNISDFFRRGHLLRSTRHRLKFLLGKNY